MQKRIHLLLGANEVGQMLDGLELRETAWRNTATFLETGKADDEFFLAEECSNADEARNIADDYKAIIEKVRKQLTFQQAAAKAGEVQASPKQGVAPGFAIYINTFCSGPVAVERNESGLPVVYATELAAQREIAEFTIERLQEFRIGERDFDDAITVEEYVEPVELHPNGSIRDDEGRTFPNSNW